MFLLLLDVVGLSGAWKDRKFAVTLTVCASGDRSMATSSSRKGSGTAIVWFRNDLRISDNEALLKAYQSSQAILPLYVVDPRLYGTTYSFGFPKTGGKSHYDILELSLLFSMSCFEENM